jgi:Amt family ammonium transporter
MKIYTHGTSIALIHQFLSYLYLWRILMVKLVAAFMLISSCAFAGETSAIDKADTLWVLISAAFVLLMLPGLAIFYAGMVRSKNVLSTMLYSMVCIFVVGIVWFLFGHSLAFAPDGNAIIGGTKYLFFNNVLTDVHGTIPESIFAMFQGMFAIITCALLSGAIVERVRFSAFFVFIIAWCMVVYVPLAHWIWGGGFMSPWGTMDFAGGIVVHISSAVASIVFIMVLGNRKGFPKTPFLPHNLPLTVFGTGLLWFGWFGFNAGSALAVDGVASLAFVNTFIAGAGGGLAWGFIEWKRDKPTALGISSGIIAGLASITNAAGFVQPLYALFIGLMGGVFCYYAILLKFRFKYDDSLDVIGIHGVGGLWGALATGLFASVGGTGLIYGNPKAFGVQVLSVAIAIAYTFVATFIILKVTNIFIKLRVSPDEETQGLDLSQHGETAYN